MTITYDNDAKHDSIGTCSILVDAGDERFVLNLNHDGDQGDSAGS